MADPACKHEDLACLGDFTHLRQNGETAEVVATLEVRCTECGAQFGWKAVAFVGENNELRAELAMPSEVALEQMLNPEPEEEPDGSQ